MKYRTFLLLAMLLGARPAFGQTPVTTEAPQSRPAVPPVTVFKLGALTPAQGTAPQTPATNPSPPPATVAPNLPSVPITPSVPPTTIAPNNVPPPKPALPTPPPAAATTAPPPAASNPPTTTMPAKVASVPGPDAAMTPANEHTLSFNPAAVLMSVSSQGWQLSVNGGHVLKSFGKNDAEARQALKTIHDLHLDQYGTVGGDHPVMEYWLASGQAPKGQTPGLSTVSIDPSSLHVEQQQGKWLMRDAKHVYYNFGEHEVDARHGLEIVKRYGFNQVATIGANGSTMQVFLTAAADSAPKTTADPKSPAPKAGASADPNQDRRAALTASMQAMLDGLKTSPDAVQEINKGVTPTVTDTKNLGERSVLDWRHLQIQQDGHDWKLMAGTQVLGHFGADMREAQQALNAMQFYRYSEERLIGQGETAVPIYLVNGQPARGPMFGMNAQVISPDKLTMQQEGQRWAVQSASATVVTCATATEAQKMIEVIKKFEFDHVSRFGRDGKGVTLFIKAAPDKNNGDAGGKGPIVVNAKNLITH